MFKASFYTREVKLSTDNDHASITNLISVSSIPEMPLTKTFPSVLQSVSTYARKSDPEGKH